MIAQTISHYKILEKLGEGGMGEVYLAEDTKLDRQVALKFLSSRYTSNAEFQTRFKREAKAIAAINHPNIVTIYEIAEHNDQFYIAMEYVEGESLREIINENATNLEKIDKILDYACQICEGLHAAHQTGIVHRDIKPANILVDKSGRVKIVDFGLAKFKDVSKLTKEATTLGTLNYMSPEQIKGADVDHRSDIFSLGVVLYEMITGQLPFKGEYEGAIFYSITNEAPEPLARYKSGVSDKLQQIVEKALNKDANTRYQSAADLRADLKALQQESTSSPQVSGGDKKNTNKRLIFAGIGLLLALTVLPFFVIKNLDSSATSEPSPTNAEASQWQNSIAVLPFKNISPDPEQEYFCDGMTEQIITNLSQLQTLKVIARTSVMKFKQTDKTVPEIAEELGVATVLEGSIRKDGNKIRVTAQLIQADGGHHLWANDYDRDLVDIFAVQDNVSQAIAGALLTELSLNDTEKLKNKQTKSVEAYQYYMRGEHFHRQFRLNNLVENSKKSEEMFKNAIALDPDYAEAFAGLADLYNSLGWNRKDGKYDQLQQKHIETAFKLDPNSVRVNQVKGHVYSSLNEIDRMYESYKRALQLNPNDPSINHSMGFFLGSQGLHYQSNKYMTKSVELNPLNPLGYSWRGDSFRRIGNFDKAMADFQNAAEIAPDFFVVLDMTARFLISLKKFDEAEVLMRRCIEINPNHLLNKNLAAYFYAAKGQKAEALLSFEQSNRKNIKFNRLEIYSLLGLTDEALNLLADKPYEGAETWVKVDLDYLDMLHNPLLDNIRDTPEFQTALQKAKQIYEENLEKYSEVLL